MRSKPISPVALFTLLLLTAMVAGCGGGTMDEAAVALSRGESDKAIEIYKYQAEEKNNAMAMRQLGTIYMTGQGVPKDYTQAEVWFQEGVKHGDGMSGTLLESLRAMRAAEGSGSSTVSAGTGGASRAETCARKRSNCSAACSASPSVGYGRYGASGSTGSACRSGCTVKYNNCMEGK